MSNRMLRWFAFSHLPEHLQEPSKSCTDLAESIDRLLPDADLPPAGMAEKVSGLRKLLEAKDCFVRAKLAFDEVNAPPPRDAVSP